MTTATAEPDSDVFAPPTIAEILHALGDISPDRLIWLPRPATEDDVVRSCDREPKRLVELVDGFLVEKGMGFRESLFAASLIGFLANFVRSRNLGVVAAPDAVMRLWEGLNRLPDVSFTAWANLPSRTAHLQSVALYAPDLAIEILSDSNTPAEMARKRGEYFAAGTQLVWIIDPDARTVAVFTDPTTDTLLTAADALDGGAVLPGFTLPLADLFNDPQLNPRV